jgi:hypothetical protein
MPRSWKRESASFAGWRSLSLALLQLRVDFLRFFLGGICEKDSTWQAPHSGTAIGTGRQGEARGKKIHKKYESTGAIFQKPPNCDW